MQSVQTQPDALKHALCRFPGVGVETVLDTGKDKKRDDHLNEQAPVITYLSSLLGNYWENLHKHKHKLHAAYYKALNNKVCDKKKAQNTKKCAYKALNHEACMESIHITEWY